MPRSGLYVQLDSNFPDDEKIEAVGLAGAGLYASSLCVAKRLLTDGRLTRRKLYALGADDALIDECIAAGLYAEQDGGVWIVAWLAHNPSADTIEDKRAKDAARKRQARAKSPKKARATSDERPAGHEADTARTEGGQTADARTREEEETEEVEEAKPEPETLTLVHPPGAEPSGFEAFWRAYPKKTSKGAAKRRWDQAVRKASPTVIVEGAERYAREVNGTPKNFLKDPDGWLNAERWTDEPGANVRHHDTGARALATADEHGASGLVRPEDL